MHDAEEGDPVANFHARELQRLELCAALLCARRQLALAMIENETKKSVSSLCAVIGHLDADRVIWPASPPCPVAQVQGIAYSLDAGKEQPYRHDHIHEHGGARTTLYDAMLVPGPSPGNTPIS